MTLVMLRQVWNVYRSTQELEPTLTGSTRIRNYLYGCCEEEEKPWKEQ